MMAETLIEFKSVAKVFEGQTVIEDLNLKINQGEIFVLVGPSGSGKTTTLKMINELIKPTDGNIYYRNKRLIDYNMRDLRWQIGYVLQQIALFPNMTVAQNITLIPEMKGEPRQAARQTAEALLQEVDLDPKLYADRKPNELSGGEQQRIGILRAIASKPEVVLMDEPFSALDPISRQQLQDLVLSLHNRAHNTIVFVTHDMNEALKLGDRIAVMHEGKIEQLDTPEAIETQPATDFVTSFFATTNPKNLLTTKIETLLPEIGHLIANTDQYPIIAGTQTLNTLISEFKVHQQLVTIDSHEQRYLLTQQSVLDYLQQQLH